ncbi:hypothetical protein MJH12_18385, partial [bacterium]|nr:hypothetical protein [bacterium]
MSEEIDVQDELVARKDRLQDIRDLGIDPFGSSYKRTHKVDQLIKDFSVAEELGQKAVAELSKEAAEKLGETAVAELGKKATTELGEYCVAGRIMNQRSMGKAAFGNLQ